MYYEDNKNIERYIAQSKAYDGRALIEILRQFVPDGASVLELGMGPGKDLLILDEYYKVVGSDLFPYFLELFREKHSKYSLELLDAISMDTKKSFDAIFSNKVLHHLSKEDLKTSLSNQAKQLNEQGMLAHSFWKGSKNEVIQETFFQYYLEEELVELFSVDFEPQVHALYSEMDRDDSIFIIAVKKS